MSTDAVGLSINAATTRRQWGLEDAAANYARLGVAGIAPWRDQIAECGLKRAVQAIRGADLAVTGLCRGGMFPAPDRQAFEAALDDNRRAIEEAHALNAACLVLVCGGVPTGSRDLSGARRVVAEAIEILLPEARAAGVRLAIEPLHPMYAADRNCVNLLSQALALCDTIEPEAAGSLGIALDAYHVWWDPDLEADLLRVAPARLHAFHICDWLVPTTDLLNDRGMMGDGAIDLEALTRLVVDRGFTGLPEVEIFSHRWWNEDPKYVVAMCLERSEPLRRIMARTGSIDRNELRIGRHG